MSTHTANFFHSAHAEHTYGDSDSTTVQRGKGATSLLRRLRQLPGIAVLALGLAAAGASPANAAGTAPLKAQFSGTVQLTGETTAALSGNGYAAPVGGNISYAGNVSNITPTPTGFTDVLVETLTTPAGDTLTIMCMQVAQQLAPGVFLGNDTWTVIGGTGQFMGATGEGTGYTNIDVNSGTFNKVLSGIVTRGR